MVNSKAGALAQGAAQVDRGSKRALAMKALCDLDLSAATKSSLPDAKYHLLHFYPNFQHSLKES